VDARAPRPPAAIERETPKPRRRRGTRITERDRHLLSFIGEHRLVLASHVQALLGISAAAAYARLHSLSEAGFLIHRRLFQGEPGCYQITHKGLQLIDSALPRPRIDLRGYRHDVGVAWLSLAARHGVFGPMREVHAERILRSHDGTPDGRADPLGVRLGGVGPSGRARLHYPDLVLVGEDGRRFAIELELSAKGLSRLEQIIAGYGADPRIDRVLYLVDDARVARGVRAAAANIGISHLVQVQWVNLAGADRAGSADAAAERATRRRRSAGRLEPGRER
jgi:DNA-binding PadR family transcriptional regulator